MLVSLKYDIQPSISFQSLEAEPKALNQHFRGYFPHKSCLLAMGQHCASNFLVQCWPRQIQTTLQIIFLWKFVCGLRANIAQVIFLSMLAKTDQEKILWVIFSQKDDCVLWADIAQIIFLSNVVSFRQHRLDNIPMQSEPLKQHCIYLCNIARRVLRHH